YIAELRDLRDQALEQNDLKLAFDIAKEEAKVMGVYLPGVEIPSFFYPENDPFSWPQVGHRIAKN
ncbi:unnamed protein product, partial [marine sediment metagenome]